MRNQWDIRTLIFLSFAATLVPAVASVKAAEIPAVLVSEGTTTNFHKALRATELVKTGDFVAAKEILLSLTQGDFARKPRMELRGEDEMEVVHVPAIGNRDIRLALCHVELREQKAAQAMLWNLIRKEYTGQDLFLLFVREFQGEGYAVATDTLNEIQKTFPRNDAALLAQQYLTVAHALPTGDISAAANLIRSGAWKRDSERGPLADFKEWACTQLAEHPQTTVPVLIEALEVNEQPTWIVYSLGQSGDQRALPALERARNRIKNYYARLEIEAAISRIKKANEGSVEPSGGEVRLPVARSTAPHR